MSCEFSVASDILVEFLEVAIHSILYFRRLYPEAIFKRVRKYGVPVYMSIHPQVNCYITECLKAAQFLIKQNELRKLIICVFNLEKNPVQRFIFDILKLSEISESDPFFISGEQTLRAFCLKLASLESNLKPLSTGFTFTIQLLTSEMSSISLAQTPELQNFPWLEVDATMGEIESPEIIPVRTIDTDYLLIQIYVEESNN